MHAQVDRLAYAHTGFFTTDAAEALADRLVRDAPDGLDGVFLASGGSEAMEATLARAAILRRDRPTGARAVHRAPG